MSPKLRFLLRAVLPAASTDSTRPSLASVQIVARDGWVEATATDGHRLHRARVQWQPVSHDAPEPPPVGTFLIARTAAEAALKALPAPTPEPQFDGYTEEEQFDDLRDPDAFDLPERTRNPNEKR
jgi:DNA polymerase III sliding clamp (beta) subunit (PCNA family)